MTPEAHDLPHASARWFITDPGLDTETGLRGAAGAGALAAHTLLAHSAGRYVLARYFRGFLSVARRLGTGFVLDSPTSKAHLRCAHTLGASEIELRKVNREAVDFVADLRDEFFGTDAPIVVNGVLGPYADAAAAPVIGTAEAFDYYGQQIGWLAGTDVDMLTASGIVHSAEAIGIVRAAKRAGRPIVLSFRIDGDGLLPTGQRLGDAIAEIDAETQRSAAYYTIDCAQPERVRDALGEGAALRRIRGLRYTAVSQRGLEPAHSPGGDAHALLDLYRRVTMKMPWINVVGGTLRPGTRTPQFLRGEYRCTTHR